jgi:MFS family permease
MGTSAKRKLAPEVVTLGLISMMTDASSEMIYPLLPVFLTTVLSAGAMQLGIIEGVAESTAAVLKMVSGFWTDRVRRRKPFVVWGYCMAGMARPLISLAGSWPFVLAMRFVDRVGKGLRTSPRDALIADVTAPEYRGYAYGFHRAMDHTGAVLGPLMAAALLYWAGLPLRLVFFCAFVPAFIVFFLVTVVLKEKGFDPKNQYNAPLGFDPNLKGGSSLGQTPFASWNVLGKRFHLFLLAVLVFTLGNSSDTFFLLRLNRFGVPAFGIALLWAAHHVIKMLSTYWAGGFSDRVPRQKLIIAGWIFYAAVYGAFALAGSRAWMIAIFLSYGIYFGLTEPVEKALVSDFAPPEYRGAAFGYYNSVIGFAALPASIIFGAIWHYWGAPAAFGTGAVLALAAALLLRKTAGGRGSGV